MTDTTTQTDHTQHPTTSFPLHRIKVALLEGIHPIAQRVLNDAGYDVQTHPTTLQQDQLKETIANAHMIGIRSRTQLTPQILDHAKHLWAVGCFCIGTDQVDLHHAATRGITVFNAPFANTRSVAEKVIAEVIALHRRLFDRSAEMHAGTWNKSAAGAREVRGKTLGIIGYGRIGSQVSILAEALGMNVIYHDAVDCLPLGNATRANSLEQLLQTADAVTIHIPDLPETDQLFDADTIARMKQGAYLINNSRGNIIDIKALANALKDNHLAGAAIDVFPQEPPTNKHPFESPLQNIPNVILTPHIGGSTQEAQRNIGEEVASKLVTFMNNGSTSNAVNVPNVQLPKLHDDHHRILHLHKNVPGVLSKIHASIAQRNANIAAQFLQTDAHHGYTILDVDRAHDQQLLEDLKAIPETIRARAVW